MYIETSEGQKAFYKQLQSDRIRVANLYNNGFHQALVDSLTPSLLDRLNANAYQKGAWVLHMLRHEMGDSIFKVGLQQFYTTYKYQNATSQDFSRLMDSLSPKDLVPFFQQWLYQVGHPQLKTRILTQKGKQFIEITQVQDQLFVFPLQISISKDGKSSEVLILNVSKRKEQFEIPEDLLGPNLQLMLDPNMKLLFEPVK
jgi:aminopeptidase N